MRHIYAVETEQELSSFQEFVGRFQPVLEAYITFLRREYEAADLPEAIIWTDRDTATRLLSDIPVPAYTNDRRVVLTPDLETWREIYLEQLSSLEGRHEATEAVQSLRAYYEHSLSECHVWKILGHELAHHSAWFLDDYDISTWFEEGMAEYIARRYFLTPEEFDAEADVNRELAELFAPCCGAYPLEEFGKAAEAWGYAGIFYDYWRAFLAVQQIINRHSGDVRAVFRSYRRWGTGPKSGTLSAWFDLQ